MGELDLVQANVWRDDSAAWPVANPIMTCASVFVAIGFCLVYTSSSVCAEAG